MTGHYLMVLVAASFDEFIAGLMINEGDDSQGRSEYGMANRQAGIPGSRAPDGYVWHRLPDGGMQLVMFEAHTSFPHTVGFIVAIEDAS